MSHKYVRKNQAPEGPPWGWSLSAATDLHPLPMTAP